MFGDEIIQILDTRTYFFFLVDTTFVEMFSGTNSVLDWTVVYFAFLPMGAEDHMLRILKSFESFLVSLYSTCA